MTSLKNSLLKIYMLGGGVYGDDLENEPLEFIQTLHADIESKCKNFFLLALFAPYPVTEVMSKCMSKSPIFRIFSVAAPQPLEPIGRNFLCEVQMKWATRWPKIFGQVLIHREI